MKNIKIYTEYVNEFILSDEKRASNFFNIDNELFDKYVISLEYDVLSHEIVITAYQNFPVKEITKILKHKDTIDFSIERNTNLKSLININFINSELINQLK